MRRTADSPGPFARTVRTVRTVRPARWRRLLTAAIASVTAATGALVIGTGTASADPSANAWLALRMCESSNRYGIDTGNGYYGAYQFSLSTWASVGGTGKPSDAKPAEQDYRALILYRKRGWSPWTCAVLARLTEDADARSGVMPPEPASFDVPYTPVSGGGTTGAANTATESALPAEPWPGQEFGSGDTSDAVAVWQRQIAALGYAVIGTGYVGPSTVAAIRDIQTKAGLDVTGTIDAKTWNAAWSLAGPVASGSGASSSGAMSGTDPNAQYRPQTKAECGVGATSAPPAPTALLSYGQTSLQTQCFQWQAGSRGAPLSGTAYFGTVTLSVVTTLQQQNGIVGELDAKGRPAIGPKTWKAAWEGTASF